MKWICIACLVLAVGACTRPNPNVCCVTEDECKMRGIPAIKGCEDGVLCRGGQCLAITCASSANCDQESPYCEQSSGHCQNTCSADDQCPGFGQASSDPFCVDGACGSCRPGMSDCPIDAPMCEGRECRACRAHDECGSGICTNGICIDESQIAHIAPAGSDTSDCSQATPCTFARANALTHPYWLVASGTHQLADVVGVIQSRTIVGVEPTPTVIANYELFYFNVPSSIENLALTSVMGGYVIECGDGYFTLDRLVLTSNGTGTGIFVDDGTATISRSTISNLGVGVGGNSARITLERSIISNNGTGVAITNTVATVLANNFVFRNGTGIDVSGRYYGTVIDSNTIADNTTIGVRCNIDEGQATFSNNLLVRNASPATFTGTAVSTTIEVTDPSTVKFVSPDATPYNYHLMPGSSAIDHGAVSDLNEIDLDGDPRGATPDIGADEVK